MSAALTWQRPDAAVAEIAAASAGRLLTAGEEQQLGRLIRLGDLAARDLMLARNDALVWSVVNRYNSPGLTHEDLHGYGVLGLMRALDDWDPERGLKFSTYAYGWVRQAVTRAIHEHGRLIRIPVHLNERMSKIGQATAALAVELGRKPTDDEICARAGISLSQLDAARQALIVGTPTSLDASTSAPGRDEYTLAEVVADPSSPDPLEQLEARAAAALARQEVATLLACLTPRQAQVLRLRFGLDGHGGERTLAAVGTLLGITRERARQIEADALGEIRRRLGVETATAAD